MSLATHIARLRDPTWQAALRAAYEAQPVCEDHGLILDPSGLDHLCRSLTEEEVIAIDFAFATALEGSMV